MKIQYPLSVYHLNYKIQYHINERAEFYMGLYRLIIKYIFVSTNSLFNNRVAHEPSPNKLTGSFASFTSLLEICLVSHLFFISFLKKIYYNL
jgi:hypothetical protein